MLTGKRISTSFLIKYYCVLLILIGMIVLSFVGVYRGLLKFSESGLRQPSAQGVEEAIGNEAGVVRRR